MPDDDVLSGPPLFDPVALVDASAWRPANEATCVLLACDQACKDIIRLYAGLQHPIHADHRGIGLLASPVVSLADNVSRLRTLLGKSSDTSNWPERDRENLRVVGRDLKRVLKGPIRTYRNRRVAHHDPEFVLESAETPTKPTLDLILPALGKSLFVLVLALNHEGEFAWTRAPQPDVANVFEFSSSGSLSPTIRLGCDGTNPQLLGVTLLPDPRHMAREQVLRTIEAYNRLGSMAPTPQPIISLGFRK